MTSDHRVVSRLGSTYGVAFPLNGKRVILQAPRNEAERDYALNLRSAGLARISRWAPGIANELTGEAFEALASEKLEGMKKFWAKQGRPLLNEWMPAPSAIESTSDGYRLQSAPELNVHFNDLMAVRQVIGRNFTDEVLLRGALEDFAIASELDVDSPSAGLRPLPSALSSSLGVNVIRIAQSPEGPVALFTVQGMAISNADATGAESRGLVGSTGGAVCVDKSTIQNEPLAALDLLHEGSRELKEETGVGILPGDQATNVSGITQRDMQFSLFQTVDHRGSGQDFGRQVLEQLDALESGEKSALLLDKPAVAARAVRSALARSGNLPTLSFFAEIRPFAPDAAEAQRYLPVPVTEAGLMFIGTHPQVDFNQWTFVMASELGAREFGKDFADRFAAATETASAMQEAHQIASASLSAGQLLLMESALQARDRTPQADHFR